MLEREIEETSAGIADAGLLVCDRIGIGSEDTSTRNDIVNALVDQLFTNSDTVLLVVKG